MIVISVTECPYSLRGDLTKWLIEISTGVYVGQVSARVREEIWLRVIENVKSGKAIMVYNSNNEQRMDFKVHNADWEPIDFDGIKLMLRPNQSRKSNQNSLKDGFSKVAKYRNAKKMKTKFNKKIFPENYAVLDIETSGLSVINHQIIEIGVLIVEKSVIVKTFQSLILSEVNIPESIEQLTGISNEMLKNEGKDIKKVLPEMLELIGELKIVSHNPEFDYSFIRHACKVNNFPLLSNEHIDTMQLSKRYLDTVADYKLSTILKYFNIQHEKLHRSLNDCIATNEIYKKLIEIAKTN